MNTVEQLEALVESAVDAAEIVKSYPGVVRVVSHYDADGIASAAIMVKALEREGKEFRLSFVKQLSEDFVKEMSGDDELLVVFTDLGSGFLKEISGHLFGKDRKIVILDHHQVQGEVPEEFQGRVSHVNPTLNGIEEDISGSGVCYLMARALSPVNKDLSELAIVGAIGDSQTGSLGPHWGLIGINKEILKDAQATGKIRLEKGLRLWGRYGRPLYKALQYSTDPYIPEVSGSESGAVQLLQELGIELKEPTGEWKTLASLSDEETRKLADGIIKERIRNGEDNPEWIFGDVYELLDKQGSFRDANEFATMLNACGKSQNAWLGVGLCLNDEGFGKDVKKVMASYRRKIGRAVDMVRKTPGFVRVTEKADYIMAGDRINEHIISNVASIIEKSCLVPEGSCHKPVFAMANTEDGQVKVSGRASDTLVKQGLSMKDIMAKVGKEFGGQGGGHAGAAGATIPADSEDRFISTVEQLLSVHIVNQEPEKAPEPVAVQESVQTPVKKEMTAPVHAGAEHQDNYIKAQSHNIEKQPEAQEPVVVKSQVKEIDSAHTGTLMPGEKEVHAGTLMPGEKGYGREHQGTGTEREGKGREEESAGREEGLPEAKKRGSPGSKEMERQGLVRYLFS